jgi:DNA-binding response OmpR family regulator
MDDKLKILLVEDDLNLGFVIKDNLEGLNYNVEWATNGKEGLKKALNETFHFAILDIMLPKMSGFDVAEEIVKHKPELPFLFLTAKSMLEDKVRGLKLGQDYLTKPFEFKELEARIENILNREPKAIKADQKVFQIGEYHFDYVNQYLSHQGKQKGLTKKEADLLRLLCLNLNEVMQRELALKSIWGSDDYFNGRSMDVFISRLRKYLKEDDSIQLINIHGVGFKLAVKED